MKCGEFNYQIMTLHSTRKQRISQKLIDRALAESQKWIQSSAYYDSQQLLQILLQAAIQKTSVEDICQSSHLPSPDTVLAQLNKSHCSRSREQIENSVAKLLQSQVLRHPSFKRRSPPQVFLALDLHDEEYYGKPLRDRNGTLYTMFSHRRGRMALRYATLSIVEIGQRWTQPLTIGFGLNSKNQKRVDVVRRLLDQINGMKMKIQVLLMDGGFQDRETFKLLESRNISWICRGKIRKGKIYPEPVGNSFEYESAGYPCWGHFFSKRSKKTKRLTFILLLSSKKLTLNCAKEVYRKRFRIENNYRAARMMKIRTTSSKIQIRWIMWAFTHFLELIWQILRVVFQIMNWNLYEIRQKSFLRLLWFRFVELAPPNLM